MSDFNKEIFWTAIQKLKGNSCKRPLVHCITNFVSANDCANALLAVGAKPVMADSPLETAEITALANALVLNMGTYSADRESAMLKSGKIANKMGIPVILDPVGVCASSFRKDSLERLLEEIQFSVIKGNYGELSCIAGRELSCCEIVKAVQKKTNSVCVLTGENDYICGDGKIYCLKNGTAKLSDVTGTGCMIGALIGAFSTVCDSLTASLCGVSLMNLCGEIAEKKSAGTGSFRTLLIDEMSLISDEKHWIEIGNLELEIWKL